MNALRLVKDGIPATARAGGRLAATGAAAAGTALQLRSAPRATVREGRLERVRLMRDLLARVTRLHGIDVTVEGAQPIGASLLACNHLSWLDPLVIGGLVPCVPISKRAVAAWPIVGALAQELGVLFVERGDGRSGMRVLRGAARVLDDGIAILNFPEGTTSRGDGVLPFHPGLLRMAMAADVPIVPMSISYDRPELAWVGDDTFLPHYVRLAGGGRARAVVRFGTPIRAEGWGATAELACAVRAAVVSLRGD